MFSLSPSEQENVPLDQSPLPIQTNQQMGLQVPLSLVASQMRTSRDQVLVISEKLDTAFLESKLEISADLTSESILESSLVRETLVNGPSSR